MDNKIILPGFVENPFKWMRNARVFVLSSTREGLPNSLIQAMACEVPVISTNCESGPAEILEWGKWGKLIKVNDQKELTNAINEKINENKKISTIKRSEYFNVESSVNKYLSLFKFNSFK